MSSESFGGRAVALLLPFWAQLGRPDPEALPLLALRRWFESLSLTSPQVGPSREALWAWLAGLGTLLVLAIVLQGPRKALGQFLDVRHHLRLLGLATRRIQRAGRMLAVLLGVTVVSWTVFQLVAFPKESRLEDQAVFLQNRSVPEAAIDQGLRAAMMPLRDLCRLGDELLLLLAATVLVFKLTSDRWGGTDDPYRELEDPLPRWTLLCWGSTWLYAMYRFGVMVVSQDSFPLGGCLVVEAIAVPVLMACSDGILLAWVLLELRRAGYSDDAGPLDVRSVVRLWPAGILACLVAVPGRYATTALWLAIPYAPGESARRILAPVLREWGLTGLQGGALVLAGMVGAAAWSGGSIEATVRGYVRMLQQHGGRLVAVLLLGGLTAGVPVGLSYLALLSLPRQPWLLTAADGYGHFASLPVGLVVLAALVDLAARALPRAAIRAVETEDPASELATAPEV